MCGSGKHNKGERRSNPNEPRLEDKDGLRARPKRNRMIAKVCTFPLRCVEGLQGRSAAAYRESAWLGGLPTLKLLNQRCHAQRFGCWLSFRPGMPRFFSFDFREGTRFGLVPRTTPLESSQSNGMAEAFVRTLKRDYVRLSPVPDAESVLRQLPGWLAHYNELHPHRAPGYRSPREFNPRGPVRSLRGNNTLPCSRSSGSTPTQLSIQPS